MLYLEHFLITDVNEANVYLAACSASSQAALIDAGGFERAVYERVRSKGFSVRYILITHEHYDHTGGLEQYMGVFPDCRVVSGGGRCGGVMAYGAQDGESLPLGHLTIRSLAVPGHTEDSMVYYFSPSPEGSNHKPPLSVLFSGDVLFAGSVGGTFSGPAHDLEVRGIRDKVFALPEHTVIYPGHGPATTVGVEKRYNPFFVQGGA